jgi:hypothetical protein
VGAFGRRVGPDPPSFFVEIYVYDPGTGAGAGSNLKRVKQVLGGETVYSVYGISGALLYRDNVTTGVATDYLRLGGKTIARLKTVSGSTTVSYLHQDHLGSPAAATDGTGAKLWRED